MLTLILTFQGERVETWRLTASKLGFISLKIVDFES